MFAHVELHHSLTWFFLPLLCWWHSGLCFFSSRCHDCVSLCFYQSFWHLSFDKRKKVSSWIFTRQKSSSFLPAFLFSTTSPSAGDLKQSSQQRTKNWRCHHLWTANIQWEHFCHFSCMKISSVHYKEEQTLPLQMIQNVAVYLIFNQTKITNFTPLFRSLHWLPVATRIRFKASTLTYRVVNSKPLRTITLWSRSTLPPTTCAMPVSSNSSSWTTWENITFSSLILQ